MGKDLFEINLLRSLVGFPLQIATRRLCGGRPLNDTVSLALPTCQLEQRAWSNEVWRPCAQKQSDGRAQRHATGGTKEMIRCPNNIRRRPSRKNPPHPSRAADNPNKSRRA